MALNTVQLLMIIKYDLYSWNSLFSRRIIFAPIYYNAINIGFLCSLNGSIKQYVKIEFGFKIHMPRFGAIESLSLELML